MIQIFHDHLKQWFSTFLHQVPPQKISVSPSTTIMLKYRGGDSSEYHQRGAQIPPVVHVSQVENHCTSNLVNLFKMCIPAIRFNQICFTTTTGQ